MPSAPTIHLTKSQLKCLKDEIAHRDFEKLANGPIAKLDPASVDAPVNLFVIKKGKKIYWWSNAVYESCEVAEDLIPFILSLGNSKERSGVIFNVSEISTWGYMVPDPLL